MLFTVNALHCQKTFEAAKRTNILRANGIANIARELYLNALNFENMLAYQRS